MTRCFIHCSLSALILISHTVMSYYCTSSCYARRYRPLQCRPPYTPGSSSVGCHARKSKRGHSCRTSSAPRHRPPPLPCCGTCNRSTTHPHHSARFSAQNRIAASSSVPCGSHRPSRTRSSCTLNRGGRCTGEEKGMRVACIGWCGQMVNAIVLKYRSAISICK